MNNFFEKQEHFTVKFECFQWLITYGKSQNTDAVNYADVQNTGGLKLSWGKLFDIYYCT